MKKHINLILMGFYVITLIVGLIFSSSILTNVSTALAIFIFLFRRNQPERKSGHRGPPERSHPQKRDSEKRDQNSE